MTYYYRNTKGLLEVERQRAIDDAITNGETPPTFPPIPGDMPQGNFYTEAEVLAREGSLNGLPEKGYMTVDPGMVPMEKLAAGDATAVARQKAKVARQSAVEAITVTTTAGNVFDGDEISQTRMARAIIALQATDTPSVNWVLHDNSVIQASVAELSEALALAGAAQAAVWVIV